MVQTEIIGNFIVFEGLDGAGTTTQSNLLKNRYDFEKIICINSCEPTKSFIGKAIREILSGENKVAPGTLAKLFAADRHEHLYNPDDGIIKLCREGSIVISDRYLFSSLAYQSLEYGFDNVLELNCSFPLPEHLFFLDVPENICQSRLSTRDHLEIYEDISMQEQILINYKKSLELFLNSGMKIHILDGTIQPHNLAKIVWSKISTNPIS